MIESYASPATMNRRTFTALPALAFAQGALEQRIAALPNFCSHEHWGSIRSIGSLPEGFRADVECGATPAGRTGVLDLLLDPYARNWYSSGGAKVPQPDTASPWKTFAEIRPILDKHRLTGVYQCSRRGIQKLHGFDIDRVRDEKTFRAVDDAIASSYSAIFDWYRKAMKLARFSELIRIVQPEYYFRGQDSASGKQERAFTRTILRVDPFLDFWRDSPRKDALAPAAFPRTVFRVSDILG